MLLFMMFLYASHSVLSVFHYLKLGLFFSLFMLSRHMLSSIFHHLQCSNSHWLWPISHPSLLTPLPSLATFLQPLITATSQVAVIKNSASSNYCEKPLSMTLRLSFSCPLSYLTLLVDIVTGFNCQAALITELSLSLSAHFVNDWAVLHKSPSEIHFLVIPSQPWEYSCCPLFLFDLIIFLSNYTWHPQTSF